MTRIRLPADDELDESTRARVQAIERAGGDSSTTRGFSHCQELFDDYFRFYAPARKGRAVDEALIELVRLKIARLNDCFT